MKLVVVLLFMIGCSYANITLNAIVRDFTPSTSPDFESYCCILESKYFGNTELPTHFFPENLVADTLDQDGKPFLRDANNHPEITR